MKKLNLIVLLFASLTLFAQNDKKAAKPTAALAPNEGIFAEMETSKGKIVLELDYKRTPVTVANFISLAEGNNPMAKQNPGKPFFNGLKFHRVIANFMIQGGDPLGTGAGDPGYRFKDEITDLRHDRGGVLSMANSGPATNGSQFFITHKETPHLDGIHTVFGHVISGMDVVNAIVQNDVITDVKIVRKGSDAKKFNAAKVFADYFANKDEEDKKQVAINEAVKKKYADEARMKAEERRAKQQAAEEAAKKAWDEKYAPVKKEKVAALAEIRKGATKTASGLEYKIIKKGTGKKPAAGSEILVNYAGYLEDGTLFDSSYEEVNKTYGKFDQRRADNRGYAPFPFPVGKKDGLIPGFLEAIETMSIGDKLVAFIPANLGYGAQGAPPVIPPNSNIIFEIEVLEGKPAPAAAVQKQ